MSTENGKRIRGDTVSHSTRPADVSLAIQANCIKAAAADLVETPAEVVEELKILNAPRKEY